jgi:hypothetical protein
MIWNPEVTSVYPVRQKQQSTQVLSPVFVLRPVRNSLVGAVLGFQDQAFHGVRLRKWLTNPMFLGVLLGKTLLSLLFAES